MIQILKPSEKETETYDSIEELKYPNEYDGGIIFLDDLNQKEMEDPRVQAMFKRSRHNNVSIFIISQDYLYKIQIILSKTYIISKNYLFQYFR